jgi:hypothetical protein
MIRVLELVYLSGEELETMPMAVTRVQGGVGTYVVILP